MKKTTRILSALFLLAFALVASGCTTDIYTVFITPPNYGIVINLNDPSSQATTNNLDNGTLMTVAQQRVNMKPCVVSMANQSKCPDAMVVEIPGAYVTRIYTADPNSGTSETKQSLCFEANGANGCVDFTVTAQVLRADAKNYANKVGILPVGEGDEARFHFKAISLEDTMDNRVIGVTSGIFSKAVATKSPLTMALDKYGLFEEVKPAIIKTIYEQTGITIKPEDMYISNGIVWSDQAIQDQINQATVLTNQLELQAQKNELLKIQMMAMADRYEEIRKLYGNETALAFLKVQVEMLRVEKWDGKYWSPFVNPTNGETIPATPAAPEVPAAS